VMHHCGARKKSYSVDVVNDLNEKSLHALMFCCFAVHRGHGELNPKSDV
jgi:hypothetical protein